MAETEASAKASTSSSDEEIQLMRITLHAAGKPTAGLSAHEVRVMYQSLATEREQEKELASERRKSQLEAAKVGLLRDQLQGHGIDATGWTEEAMTARLNALTEERKAKLAEQDRERRAEQARRRAESLFKQSLCPELHVEHLDAIDNGRNPKWIEIRDQLAMRTGLADGYLVALLGIRGTGKTQLAVSVAHRSCQRQFSARYIKALDLFRLLRRAYTPREKGEAGESEEELVEPLARVDLLIIDECHQRGETDFEQNTLINLLDRRYDSRRCTILIANQTKEEFAKSMTDSVVSRINETGEAFICDWTSYRKKDSWRNYSKEPRKPSSM